MITFSLSYETILFSLLALVAVLTVVVAVALYRDFRAGVFVELGPCIVCGVPDEHLFCMDCHEQTAMDIVEPVEYCYGCELPECVCCALCENATKLPDVPYCDFCDEYLFELSGGVRIKFPPRECQLCGERFVIQEEPCTHTGEGHRV